MKSRTMFIVVASSLLWLSACGDAEGTEDTTSGVVDTVSAADTAALADTAEPDDTTEVAASDVDAAQDASDADAAGGCPADRVPRVVDDVVVDPCGCCAVGGEYCHGLRTGGSPYNGTCPLVYDAVPPCTTGRDENGCETLDCTGSCIGPFDDTQQGDPDAS